MSTSQCQAIAALLDDAANRLQQYKTELTAPSAQDKATGAATAITYARKRIKEALAIQTQADADAL